MNYTDKINEKCRNLTTRVESFFEDMSKFSLQYLKWISLEHFQFSFTNPSLLLTAAQICEDLDDKKVSDELYHNLEEEQGHWQMYRKALSELGIESSQHINFKPTNAFFKKIREELLKGPSNALGTMYAIEATSVFEHEIFRKISFEIIDRGYDNLNGSSLLAFHDLHLSGVEQAHRDELGKLIDLYGENSATNLSKSEICIQTILASSYSILDDMCLWWEALLASEQNFRS